MVVVYNANREKRKEKSKESDRQTRTVILDSWLEKGMDRWSIIVDGWLRIINQGKYSNFEKPTPVSST